MLTKIISLFSLLLMISGCSINKLAINATGSIIEYGMDALMEESDLVLVLMELKDQMKEAAQKLEFEKAAEIRDLIRELEGAN